MTGINISAFFAGASTAFYLIFACLILRKSPRTRFQTVLGWMMAIWAAFSLKDIIITFPVLYKPHMLNYIALIDGWSAVSYVVFIFEATMPGWTSRKKVLLLLLPFLFFTLAYVFYPIPQIINAYYIFLWCFAWTVVGIGYFKARRYIRYIRENYSNIENIDLSWLRYVFFFAIVSQLSWLATSILANVFTDTIYYISTMGLWLLVLHFSYNYQPIAISNEKVPATEEEDESTTAFPFAHRLEEVMEQEALYLNKDLTLTDLAVAIGTNRTYLSRYLSQVQQQTFYDYINRLRLNKKSIPLMKDHPEYTLEFVASESGFKSISTFRRAFIKLTGLNPSNYFQK